MNRRISDLMDHIPYEDVKMEQNAPLSSQRIKELTMEKIDKKAPRGRIGFKILFIAAMIAMLSMSVLAAESIMTYDDWLTEFFAGKEVVADISENQLALLESSVKQVDQSVSSGGYTVTLETAVTDGYVAYLTFRLDGPEGEVLEDAYYYFESWPFRDLLGESIDDGVIKGAASGWRRLEDLDPTDNSVRVLLELSTESPDGWERPLADGAEKTVILGALVKDVGPDYEPEILAEGDWSFTFAFGDSAALTAEVEMLSAPVYCTARRQLGQRNFNVTLKVTSFRLRALTASCIIEEPLTGFWEGILLDEITVVMRDGSRVTARFGAGSYGGGQAEIFFSFDVPISFRDVDYVEFAGGDRAYMPGAAE